MRTPKLLKGIARKFKNWKTNTSKETATQEPKISSSAEGEKPSEEVLSVIATVVTANIGAKDENSKEVYERPLMQQKKVITINPELKAKLVDDLVWEEECKDSLTIEHTPSIGDSEVADNQLIYEKSATASIETAIQEPNAHDSPSSAESRFDATDEKDKPLTTQAVIFGIVGTALLVGSVVFYVLEVHVTVAIAMGIVGLACIGFALYNIINPNTKLEKVESVKQPIVESPLNPT